MATETEKALQVLRATIPSSRKTQVDGTVVSGLVNLVRMLGMSWPYGPDRPMTVAEAMRLSAVQVCVDVIAQDIAKVPLELRERLPGGGNRVVDPNEHPVAMLLANRPNPWHTWFEFHEMVVIHLACLQNAFVGLDRLPSGDVRSIVPFLPGRARVLIDPDDDSLFYEFQIYHDIEKAMARRWIQGPMDAVILNSDEVMHLRGRVIDGIFGYSNMDAGAKTMWLVNEIASYQTRLYRNDASYRGVFKMKEGAHLEEEAFARLREQLAEATRNAGREGRPLLLEDGLDFTPTTMTGVEAAVDEARKAAILDVARLFRVPPHKISALDSVKYDNMDTAERAYVGDTLIPYCIRIEQQYQHALLPPADRGRYFFQFNRPAMELSDPEKMAAVTRVMLGHGAMTIDEARQTRGLNPLPANAGEVRLVPSTMNVVDESNEIIIQAGGAKPGQTPESAADDASDAKGLRLIEGGRHAV